MLSEILKPADVAKRYGVSIRTARRYMRDMPHMEDPLMVTERAISNWELTKTVFPAGEMKIPRRR